MLKLKLPKDNLIEIKKFATVNPNLNFTVNKVMGEFHFNRFLSTRSMSEVAPRLSSELKALLNKQVVVKDGLLILDVAAITGKY